MLSFKKGLFWLVMMLALVVGVSVDAWLTKTIVWNTQYQNNGVVQYQVSYTNTGTVPVTVRLSDTLPTSLAALPLSATCNGTASPWSTFTIGQNLQTLSTNFCILQPGLSATMSYSAMILSQSFVSITNTANVALYSWSTFISNQTASASFFSYPVLSVAKNFIGIRPQRLNDLVTFTIRVTNSGAAIANNITVTDTLPNGFEYVSSSLPGTPAINVVANTVTWTVPTVPANSFVEYVITAKLATSIPWAGLNVWTSIVNTVTIATGGTTTPSYVTFGSGGTTSSVNFTIAGIPSVTLTKVLTSPVNRILSFSGATASYTITVTNTGTETAIGSITDILPSELTGFSSSLTPSIVNGNTWTWTGITLAPWASTTITLNGILSANYQSNRVFTNTANFTYAPNTSTGGLVNNGVATGLIQWLPNLVLQKNLVRSAPAGQSGDVVVYALTVTNSSATAYTGSRCLVDAFPSQISITSTSLSQSNCGNLSANQIAFSGIWFPQTIILTGVLNNTYSSGTVINNIWSINIQTGLELLSTDNTDSAAFTIGGSDLVLNKTVWATTYTGTPGTPVTYTLQYANNGSIAISGVVLTDSLPSNLVYSASSIAWASLSWSTVTRNLGTLSAGQSGSITLTALISGYVQWGIVTNMATLSSAYQEANIQNNTASASFTVTPALADLRIVKSIVSQGTYMSGTQYTFRFDVSNSWGLTATGVRITDVLPSIFSYASGYSSLVFPWGQWLTFNNVTNTITSDQFVVSPGQSMYFLVTTVLNNNILTTTNYTNTGTISSITTDALLSNNTSSVNGTITAPVISCSGLNYTITANSPLSNPVGLNTLSGVAVSYTYTLTNNFPLPIESLSVGTTWSSQVSPPSGLTAGIVGTANNIPTGSWVSYTLAGTTIVDGIANITTPATFTVKVSGGQPFTCNASSVLSVSQSCGNTTINSNLGEQCENYNGTVLLAPWVSFNPTTQACDASCKLKTTKITNCVDMTVGGVIKNACVDTTNPLESPVLTIKKYVNNQDAQDNSTAVALSNGSTASYRIVITNTSSFTAYNVRLSDTLPSGVTYIANSVSPTTISYTDSTRTLSGNLWTLAAWASVTITFNATVNSTNGFINNIATVNYTDSLGIIKPPVSDPAVITLWSSPTTCNNGIKEWTESCDLGNLPRTIGNYLDTTTNYPTISERGKTCNTSCQIVDPGLNRCGDGVLGRLEQCDLWWEKPIWQYLNASGTLISAGTYWNWTYTCTNWCAIKSNNGKFPAAPACRYTDTVISVMKEEKIPLAWDVELGQNTNTVSSQSECNGSNNGAIIKNTMICTIEIYAPWQEQRDYLAKQITTDCSTKQWTDQNGTPNQWYETLFKEFSWPIHDSDYVRKPYGSWVFDVSDFVNNKFGEYKFSLQEVKYNYCTWPNQSTPGNPYARVCQVNFAVTDHYLMQKGSVSTKTNSTLENYFMLDGTKIFEYAQLNSIDKLASLSYANLSSSMKTLTNNLIAKYEKIAVTTNLDSNLLRKVPGKSIYIKDGNITFRWEKNDETSMLDLPTTLIVKWNIIIEWNIPFNMLIIAKKVKFVLPSPTIINWWRKDWCKSQVIRGIIVAQDWFESSWDQWYKNTNLNNPRCRKGNLQVYGVLIGNDLQKIVDSRRSHLEHWFTFERDNATLNNNDSRVKAERRKEIYEGASVYIEQNPSLWRDMPPGADEFLKTLNVSRS